MNYNLIWLCCVCATILFIATACTSPAPTATAIPSPLPTRAPSSTPTPPPIATATSVPNRQPAAPAAITPARTPALYSPAPGDEKLQRGNVFLNEKNIVSTKSMPPQISLQVSGSLPTPCHKLRIQVAAPNAQNEIRVNVYSVVDSSAMCIQMIAQFDASVPLENLAQGKYSVWINDQGVGEITMP